ncbi:uncharacterized protein [Typha angustifolia]|uniref:uncharacterized protein n=1 Tax=Typha angustifolia TaxID=59011 RepID=UPI003C2F5BC3
MLCLKAEALGREMFASHGVVLSANLQELGSSIHRAMKKVGGKRGFGSRRSDPAASSASSSGDASASCSGLEDDKSSSNGRREGKRSGRMRRYRTHLEEEVKKLQRKLQEEIELHVALANAVANNSIPLLNSPTKLPYKAQELLASIASLEITVSKLEQELVALQLRFCHERKERQMAESNLGFVPSVSSEPPTSISSCTWEERISSLRDLKFGGSQISRAMEEDLSSGYEDGQLVSGNILLDNNQVEMLESCSMNGGREMNASFQQSDETDSKMDNINRDLWQNPNQLSEEMLRCMRNIFLCLSESSKVSSKVSSSECSSSSPLGHLSSSSFTSFSNSSIMPSMLRSPSVESNHNDEIMDQIKNFDPYGVNGRINWRDIGSYSFAPEVSWMSVGKEQLEYAAEALRKFRFLVEQLAKVNPATMSCDERLAFWINLYNALIMHAYLAYGVPRSDIKLFSLMQKACYTVGGQSVSAAEIEYVILKMKAPVHRPQLALILALHKFKITEEHRKYSIDNPEPLAVFALSCGMFSSPAVKIFSAENVHQELENSMRDYIRASIGISDKGKLLVPKLLHGFAKGVVEDSLLVDWICRYLSPDQVAIIRDCTSQRKQRLLTVRSFTVVPFDLRFRYLFLPDNKTIESSSKYESPA